MKSDASIFGLGDSRTGTTSLHDYFLRNNINSIHFFFDEANQKKPNHLHHQSNWVQFQKFVDSGKYKAFTDYPTRSFYHELVTRYPDAYFILTTRKDTSIWQNSMTRYFSKIRKIEINLKSLTNAYLSLNQEIHEIYNRPGVNFLEICIEDGNEFNSQKLCNFLNLDPKVQLRHIHRSKDQLHK